MAHKARTKKPKQPAAHVPTPADQRKPLTAEALALRLGKPNRPEKRRRNKLEQPDGFGKADLAAWKKGPGSAKSWKLPNTQRSIGLTSTVFVMQMALAGTLVTQLLRPALPFTLLKTATRLVCGQTENIRPKHKSTRKARGAICEDFGGARPNRWYRHDYLGRGTICHRFIFKQRQGIGALKGRFFEEYSVQDKKMEHSHLVGFMLAGDDAGPLLDITQDFHICPITHGSVTVDGRPRLAVVGKRLEQPSPFATYRCGTMAARVRRYYHDFPKPGAAPGKDTELRSVFIASLEKGKAQEKAESKQSRQRRRRQAKRAEASCMKVIFPEET